MRKISLLLIICIISMTLSSCYDANEVDNLLHVNIIGVDRGIADKWRLTVMFPTLKEESEDGSSGSGGGQGLQNEYDSISVDAPSFFTGIDMINSTLARRLNFMHAEFLVISEDLAKSKMLREFIDSIIRFRQIRRSMHVFVSKCSAMELVEAAEPAVGTALSKNMQILVEESKITGFFPHVTLENFYEQMKSTYQQPAVMVQSLSSNKNFDSTLNVVMDGIATQPM
jgi:spore germination protein KC